jgi:plastocyanin
VIRRHFSFAILLLVLGLALAGCGGDDNESSGTTAATTEASAGDTGSATTGASATTLNGSVGPGFDISLDGTDGLTAGSYTLVVNDQSDQHNFHLTGPGVDVSTEVSETGEKSFDIELQAGEYKFVCDPHASQMNGTFTVG